MLDFSDLTGTGIFKEALAIVAKLRYLPLVIKLIHIFSIYLCNIEPNLQNNSKKSDIKYIGLTLVFTILEDTYSVRFLGFLKEQYVRTLRKITKQTSR